MLKTTTLFFILNKCTEIFNFPNMKIERPTSPR
jgi:hypothetical protein